VTEERQYLRAKRDYDGMTGEIVSFDMTDSKGRRIGARISRLTAEYKVGDTGTVVCLAGFKPEGVYFEFRAGPTRNGVDYGAWPRGWQGFLTEAEREAAIATYLNGAKKRAMAKGRG
jgi:hypothetical protein